ncbi:class I SAM-dependent methyltransferase [Mesorhizobium sp. DCY119]|uniref:class I SAM-dependent methyltransferase n=1 Tax=Mesorhizobium sp. DCY119 TaxID=2108445 RepID=UPI001402D4DB|nr:class I SAM-dependent methyltransferase [Mesorhizobium sp. DCY119]
MVGKEALNTQYWQELQDKSALAGITLDSSISPADFRIYGDRLAQRQIEMFQRYGQYPLSQSTVIDLGCGLGRVSLPFSRVFASVTAIDINRRILDAGRTYCADATNIVFIENDGATIPLPSSSVEYCYCGGVLQHIKVLSVILDYFREGLRILKPGGLLNYSIQTWMDDIVSGNNIGKRITANDLNKVLSEFDCEALALIEDPKDPVPHLNVVILKKSDEFLASTVQAQLRDTLLVRQDVRTGIWEDLPSYQKFARLWAGPRKNVTFWS